jgi:hypothetical protein
MGNGAGRGQVWSSPPGTDNPCQTAGTPRKGHPTLALRTHRPAALRARREEMTPPTMGRQPGASRQQATRPRPPQGGAAIAAVVTASDNAPLTTLARSLVTITGIGGVTPSEGRVDSPACLAASPHGPNRGTAWRAEQTGDAGYAYPADPRVCLVGGAIDQSTCRRSFDDRRRCGRRRLPPDYGVPGGSRPPPRGASLSWPWSVSVGCHLCRPRW